jgi:hypothetical protein
MHQSLHLLIVDADAAAVLASWHGGRWLLPMLQCDERTRAGRSIAAWMADRAIAGTVVGQWLGRAAPHVDTLDWLLVVRASVRTRPGLDPALSWTPLAAVASSCSLLDYQQWAVSRALEGSHLPRVHGPFGTVDWPDAVTTWTGTVLGERCRADPPFRCSPSEVVLPLSTPHRTVFFKGLSLNRTCELAITAALASCDPDGFPSTIAAEARRDGSVWWLMDACPGIPLAHAPTRGRVEQAAVAAARAQQRLADRRSDSHPVPLPVVAINDALVWARDLLGEQREGSACVQALERACAVVEGPHLPRTWTPLDLDPGNVLIEGRAVRFIDLDDSFLGPAPLAAATLARRLRRLHPAMNLDEVVRHAYEQAWSPRLMLGSWWTSIEIASKLLEEHLGWKRAVLKTERGEITGVLEMATPRIVRRLGRTVQITTGHGAGY